jgi:hypothetical protein
MFFPKSLIVNNVLFAKLNLVYGKHFMPHNYCLCQFYFSPTALEKVIAKNAHEEL